MNNEKKKTFDFVAMPCSTYVIWIEYSLISTSRAHTISIRTHLFGFIGIGHAIARSNQANDFSFSHSYPNRQER